MPVAQHASTSTSSTVVTAPPGGILHTATSTAQTLPDPDTAYDLERAGLKALALAAAYQH